MSLDGAAVDIFAAEDPPDTPNRLLEGAENPEDFVCGLANGLGAVDKVVVLGEELENGLEVGEVFLNIPEVAVLVCLHIYYFVL